VAIARAVARGPEIVLADEPTGNLDAATGHTIIELLFGLYRERDTTLVLVTHDPEVAGGSDRVVELRDGHIVDGTGAARSRERAGEPVSPPRRGGESIAAERRGGGVDDGTPAPDGAHAATRSTRGGEES
jgi:ABC-type glutathione transport system ATPase component